MTEPAAPARRVAAQVSVAIATMDRPEGALRCVRGLLEGRVLPAEIVVIDQSSDDATERAVAVLGASVPVIYRRDSGRGLSRSRNLGIQVARGDIIAFTDDDCVPDAGWVEAIDREFRGDPELAGVTGRVLPLGPEQPGFFAVSMRTSTDPVVYRGKAVPWRVGTGGNTAVRRGWLERIGGFDERLGAGSVGRAAEDLDLLYHLLVAGGSIRYEPDAVVRHERQPRERRLASRPSYGYGTGAFCALWIRKGDGFAARLLARWAYERARALIAGAVRMRGWKVREELLMLQGMVQGLVGGLALSKRPRGGVAAAALTPGGAG